MKQSSEDYEDRFPDTAAERDASLQDLKRSLEEAYEEGDMLRCAYLESIQYE